MRMTREDARRETGQDNIVHEAVESQNPVAVNPRRAHFNAGTAKDASGASFAQDFRAWWYTQKRFAKQEDLAAAIGASVDGLRPWLTGRAFPSDPLCDKLSALTQLDCFSPAGRGRARLEHEQKRGLSRNGIAKRAMRQYLTAEEFAECRANPDKAFAIRGDEWIACLECGLLLKQIRDRGSAAHLKEHGITDAQYRTGLDTSQPRYGLNRGLICNALAAKKRAQAAENKNFKPEGGAANLRPQRKGWTVPPEFRRKQSLRMRGQRKPGWAKNIADVEFVWAWLIEDKTLEKVAAIIRGLSPDSKFSLGGVHRRLKAIIGLPIRKALVPAQESASRAVMLVHDCGGEAPKIKAALAHLCEESRNEVAGRTKNPKARPTMLWIPHALSWLRQNQSRAVLSSSDVARLFLATEFARVTKTSASRVKVLPPEKRGPKPKKATIFIEAKRLDSKAFAEDPRKASEAMRQGVRRLAGTKSHQLTKPLRT
jgi:hypothetical protein